MSLLNCLSVEFIRHGSFMCCFWCICVPCFPPVTYTLSAFFLLLSSFYPLVGNDKTMNNMHSANTSEMSFMDSGTCCRYHILIEGSRSLPPVWVELDFQDINVWINAPLKTLESRSYFRTSCLFLSSSSGRMCVCALHGESISIYASLTNMSFLYDMWTVLLFWLL